VIPAGSYAPLLTPLLPDGSVDEMGLERLIRHVLAGGASGVLVLGSSGENTALGSARREQVVHQARQVLDRAGRGTLLVGVAQCALAEAEREIAFARTHGADAVLVTPPFYGTVTSQTVESFYRTLAATAGLPMFAYHIPAFTGVSVPADLVGRLAADGVLAGIKDSDRNMEYFHQVLAATRDAAEFSAFTGSDALILPALLAGGAGAITVGANIVPEWTSGLCSAASGGRWERAVQLQRSLAELVPGLRVGQFPGGFKSAAAELGLCGRTLAPPGAPLTDEQHAQVRELLHRHGIRRPPSDGQHHADAVTGAAAPTPEPGQQPAMGQT
jgi:4-hydroxy-tetrahydrodipicolinate synthase